MGERGVTRSEIIQRNLNSFSGQGSKCVFNMFSTAPKKNCLCVPRP